MSSVKLIFVIKTTELLTLPGKLTGYSILQGLVFRFTGVQLDLLTVGEGEDHPIVPVAPGIALVDGGGLALVIAMLHPVGFFTVA